MSATTNASDLPADLAKSIGVPAKHQTKGRAKPPARLSKDAVRSFAL